MPWPRANIVPSFLTLLLCVVTPLPAEPQSVDLELVAGLNLVGVPAHVSNVATFAQMLGPVSEVLRLDASTQVFESCTLVNDTTEGEACALPVVPGEGLLIFATDTAQVSFGVDIDCPTIALGPGLNLVSFPCAAEGLTGLALVAALGDAATVATVQAFDTDTGRWVNAVYENELAAGVDFPIVPGHAYLVHMLAPVTLTPPTADAGPDQIGMPGEFVTFDGSNSAPAGLDFRWRLDTPANCDATLHDPNSPTPSFVPKVNCFYRGLLTVSDGLSQSTDEAVVATDPTGDSDSDGLTDEEEIITYGTDPSKPDTDGDGFSDGLEVNEGNSDPLDETNLPAAIVEQAYGAIISVFNTAPPGSIAYGPMVSVFNRTLPESTAYGPLVSVFNEAPPDAVAGTIQGPVVSVENHAAP